MVLTPSPALDTPVFVAEIRPHRSLGPQGFRVLMTLLCAGSIIMSLPFVFLRFWPVVGLFGLDFIGLYIAFRVSYRQGMAFEILELTPVRLLLRKVDPRGVGREWRFNPLWTRLNQEIDPDFGMQRLSVSSRGEEVVIARDLSPGERECFAEALGRALAHVKGGR
jgi:uncharacterized membrane protein